MDDRLDAARLRDALDRNVVIGRQIIVRDETTSTNDSVWHLAKSGATEGLVVFAEHQSAGRGQHGNSWESAARKGLWFSFLLRPQLPVRDSPKLTLWATKMVAWTIEIFGRQKSTIKLPNDIYVGPRKIAGVLVEMRAQLHAPHLAIVGVGLNVNQRPHDFSEALRERAGSLALLCGGPLDRTKVAVDLLRKLDATYHDGTFL